ncbi:bifunctional diaminohydroxyphosphoribosylaminopyrimidine deaminase/5-amino-6-(5-phosphoribosylamino)uracil reductase RibD [Pontimonas sp.]|nr:bifunctional diaminohydroxyphosphoribosylaminopyrimidine deaminase/5-amino-6-(5-phosphoribosylamino)uracil reductase RibD [Pontimonas sp.]
MTLPPDTAIAEAMQRARVLALNGPPGGANPQVGCVLVDSHGNYVAEGWHNGSGTPHAEAMALQELKEAGQSATGLTAVVTLEPCSHTGKTPPCANALVESGISHVVFSAYDPGRESGGGSTVLIDAGVDVHGGFDETEGTALIEKWLFARQTGRPWVTIKWAMSLDGRAAAADGTSQWITSPTTRAHVHLDRSRHGAIAVGSQTMLVDNPTLTARHSNGSLMDHQPHAVVVGSADIPSGFNVIDHPAGLTHYTSRDLPGLMSVLFGRGITSLYVEGGPTLASAFLSEGLCDEVHISIGPLLLGGPKLAVGDLGIRSMSEALELDIHSVDRLESDIFVVARPRKDNA